MEGWQEADFEQIAKMMREALSINDIRHIDFKTSEMDSLSTTTSFHKRSRRGKVLKIVAERYTRTDITLGYLHKKLLLHADLASLMQSVGNNHLIVLDTNILMHVSIYISLILFTKHYYYCIKLGNRFVG